MKDAFDPKNSPSKLTRRDFLRAGLGGLAAVSTLGLTSCSSGRKLRSLPNILFISIDTLRADHIGCYGYFRDTTPNISRFAEEGVLFENCISQSNNTLVSHMSMITSLYPETHRITLRSVYDEEFHRLPRNGLTLTERLSNEGYTTAGCTAAACWLGSNKFGFDHGFDFYVSTDSGKNSAYEECEKGVRPWKPWVKSVRPASDVNKDIFDWFKYFKTVSAVDKDMRFFLFVHYMDPHGDFDRLPHDSPMPYKTMYCEDYTGDFTGGDGEVWAEFHLERINNENIPVSEEDLEYIIALYDGEITYTDEYVRRLLEHLRRLGYYDNTLIVLTADHGQEFRDHGNFLKKFLYQEVVHVPLIVKFPGNEHKGKKVSTRVRTVDIAPTILGFLGMPSEKMQGQSLLDVIGNGAKDRAAYSGEPFQHSIITPDGWKYSHVNNKNIGRTYELYDLRNDPAESRNLYSSQPERVAQIEEMIAEWREKNQRLSNKLLGPSEDSDKEKFTPEMRDTLKAIGYL